MNDLSEKLLKFLKSHGPSTGIDILKAFPESYGKQEIIGILLKQRKIAKFVNKNGVISYKPNI